MVEDSNLSFNFFFIAYTKPRFATFVKYGKTELTPPSPTELPAAVAQAVGLATKAITFQWAGLTVKVSDCAYPISQT